MNIKTAAYEQIDSKYYFLENKSYLVSLLWNLGMLSFFKCIFQEELFLLLISSLINWVFG